MNKKRASRYRRAQKTRKHIKRMGFEKGIARLCVFRSGRHIYAQVLAPIGGKVLAFANSLEKGIKGSVTGTKTEFAKEVGKLLAQRAKEAGVESVASDRSGYRYHGRVAALIESARENGLVV